MLTRTSIVKDKISTWSTAALIVLTVAASQAQPTDKVVITMDEPCRSTALDKITVVLTVGSRTVQFSAIRNKPSEPWEGQFKGPWKGPYKDAETFPADRATASLRLKGTRTDCQHSSAAKNDKNEDVALFSFHCNHRAVRDVEIGTNDGIGVNYLRKDASASCSKENEHRYFTGGVQPDTVPDLWIPGEELRLQLGWDKPDTPDPGLLLFSRDAKASDAPVFSFDSKDSSVLLFLDRLGRQHKLKARNALSLEVEDVVETLARQRSAPNGDNSARARTNDDMRLKRAGLTRLTLAVR